ncbi:helix-turn-helix domain-containing protein [Sinomicrobium weinanense]|uniref:Helix-turn-helix transcriptional regulator n=1 Tax=Sinomicrobium weinanense TaxID=2842200 RepID=A0A926Q4V0_9FLAO|nr:AraC family transcriptional regulator [Sinomicrobium weinanense]MBC9797471.1 helix-turn-helix transcriptional regulator [Sinomicrobium weinanense]MBU3124463.1 AraC family transcriptional regulator [Sinomicrobium weinanense]
MKSSESLTDFYRRVSFKSTSPASRHRQVGELDHFNVYRRNDMTCKDYSPYNRRDFYKISLIIGSGTLYYADKGIAINKRALLFSNPNIPYAWEAGEGEQTGYFCLFTDGFVNTNHQSESLQNSPLFRIGGKPVYFIDEEQEKKVGRLFEKMLLEIDSDYRYKYDLIRNYMNLVMHEALKMQPADSYFKHTDAASRIAAMFFELLERQFPVSHEHILQLRSANDYAQQLSVHTNHLNRAVKKVTGKTTTEHISARLIKEARTLLKHTDWNIAEAAYCLGFENPAYFNNFFRKQTGKTPRGYREGINGKKPVPNG